MKHKIRIQHKNTFARKQVAFGLTHCLQDQLKDLVFVCIGSNRSTGDSLGPIVGTKLHRLIPDIMVYGTLDDPVHAKNLQEHIDLITNNHPKSCIIAVDACLGRFDSVGFIDIGVGPIRPGSGVNKELPSIGDLHINGIVNIGGFMPYFVLQNTPLNLVMNMADVISNGIHLACMSRRCHVSTYA